MVEKPTRRVPILLIVWNRLEYTQMTLESVLSSTKHPFELHIVDNGSEAKTATWLKSWVEGHQDIVASFTVNPKNIGISPPTLDFWKKCQAAGHPYFGKIDNDIVFPEGWLGRLVDVMEKCPSVAVASVCHYPRDFEREAAAGQTPIEEENGVKFNPRTHVGGCGYLLRAAAQKVVGDLDIHMGMVFGWTKYQNWLNGRGWKTAYAYPFVPVEHLGEWNQQRIKNDEYSAYEKVIWDFRHPARKK